MIEDLFLDNKPLSMFKKPSNLYDFKKKVPSVMKLRYIKVTGHGTHSGDVVSGDQDVSAVDHLAVKLFMEMTLVFDKEEAACHEAELRKAQKKSLSNILVPPPPPPDLPFDFAPQMQQSAAVPLSVLTGIITSNNNVHSLDEEMAAIVTTKVEKGQSLTMIVAIQSASLLRKVLAFTVLSLLILRSKQKLTTAAFCFNC